MTECGRLPTRASGSRTASDGRAHTPLTPYNATAFDVCEGRQLEHRVFGSRARHEEGGIEDRRTAAPVLLQRREKRAEHQPVVRNSVLPRSTNCAACQRPDD